MARIAITVLLFLAWHFPTTFFVPAGPPNEKGWIIWPFGQQTRPTLELLQGVLAPASGPTTTGATPTVAMVAAGVASVAFIVAIAGVWGIVVPAAWWQTAATVGAVCSLILVAIYASPLALIPLVVDLVVLTGALGLGWKFPAVQGS